MKKLLETLNKDIGEISREIAKSEMNYSENFKKEHANIKKNFREKEYNLGMTLYEGKSELLIPHFPNDKGALNLRSTLLNSVGVNIQQNNYTVHHLLPSNNYQIACTVVNNGDLPVPLANVEFFISPKFKPYKFEMEIVSSGHFLGTTIRGKILKGAVVLLDHIRILTADHVIHARVNGIIIHPSSGPTQTSHHANEGQDVTLYVSVSKPTQQSMIRKGQRLVDGGTHPPIAQRAFRFRIKDVFNIVGRGTVVTGKVEQGTLKAGEKVNFFKGDSGKGNIMNITTVSFDRLNTTINTIIANMEVGILLRNFKGTITKGNILVKYTREPFTEIIESMPEPEKVNEYEFLGRKTISVPAMDSSVVTLPFRTSGTQDRSEYIFTCRVFATTPVDMPDDFDILNPKKERRVGAKKIPWQP